MIIYLNFYRNPYLGRYFISAVCNNFKIIIGVLNWIRKMMLNISFLYHDFVAIFFVVNFLKGTHTQTSEYSAVYIEINATPRTRWAMFTQSNYTNNEIHMKSVNIFHSTRGCSKIL